MTDGGGSVLTLPGKGPDEPSGSRADAIRQDILAAILEHRLRPGTKLGEDEVGSIYGVSRTIVRAALLSLAHDGIVVIEKNRGAFVAHPSTTEAREVFEARRMVERTLVERAAERCDEAAATMLAAHVARERAALEAGDQSAAIRLTGEFHLLLARIADHRICEGFLRELVMRSSLIILLYRRAGAHPCNCDHHGLLVRAIRDGRTADATAQMETHLREIEEALELVETTMIPRPLAEVLGAAAGARAKAR